MPKDQQHEELPSDVNGDPLNSPVGKKTLTLGVATHRLILEECRSVNEQLVMNASALTGGQIAQILLKNKTLISLLKTELDYTSPLIQSVQVDPLNGDLEVHVHEYDLDGDIVTDNRETIHRKRPRACCKEYIELSVLKLRSKLATDEYPKSHVEILNQQLNKSRSVYDQEKFKTILPGEVEKRIQKKRAQIPAPSAGVSSRLKTTQVTIPLHESLLMYLNKSILSALLRTRTIRNSRAEPTIRRLVRWSSGALVEQIKPHVKEHLTVLRLDNCQFSGLDISIRVECSTPRGHRWEFIFTRED